jgi:photoactive yellow protein
MSIDAQRYVEQVSEMSREELDALPLGVITLAPDGTVKRYNKAEADLAHKDVETVIGANFFTTVAPCTANANFQGKFEELVAKEWGITNFDYLFKFPWGDKSVHVTFVKKKGARDVDALIVWR